MERDDRPLVDIFNIIFQALKLAEKDELVDIKNNINESVELKNKVCAVRRKPKLSYKSGDERRAGEVPTVHGL